MWVCTHCTDSALLDGYILVARLRFNGDTTEAFKSIIADFKGNSSSVQKAPSQNINTDQAKKQKETKKQQEQELLSKKEAGAYHTEAILALCVKDQHGYFIDKGYINHKERITTKDYEVDYERPNHTTGKMEKKIQKIPQGSAIIALHEIESPNKKTSFQFIHPRPDPTTGKYYKGMLVDAPSDGIHIIYGDATLPYIGIVEGKATGKAVYITTGATVIVAFNANGMSSKAEQVQAFFSGKQLVAFGDNDKSNTGQNAAHKVVALTNGLAIIPPELGDWVGRLSTKAQHRGNYSRNRATNSFIFPN